MQKMFLLFLRPIFALKVKIAPPPPPPIGFGNKKKCDYFDSGQAVLFFGLHRISGKNTVRIQVKTFFLFIYLFGLHLIYGTKPFQFQV